MTHCNFPGRDEHTLTPTYWQVPGLGDICDPCHREWLAQAEAQQNTALNREHDLCDPTRACATHGRCWTHSDWDSPLDAVPLAEPPTPPPRASRFTFKVLCRRPSCDNRARYNSGYCGVCDITENAGRGERRERIGLAWCAACRAIVKRAPTERCVVCTTDLQDLWSVAR